MKSDLVDTAGEIQGDGGVGRRSKRMTDEPVVTLAMIRAATERSDDSGTDMYSNIYRAMHAARPSEWQPIETAPRTMKSAPRTMQSGPRVLLCGGYSNAYVCIGKWKAARTNAWVDDAGYRLPRTPTHWRPLPDGVEDK